MIYLDYNSTHPPIEFILRQNLDLYLKNYANPSGISLYSQKNFSIIEHSRKKIKELLKKFYNFDSQNSFLVFNSTGTEAIYQMVHSFFEPSKPYAIVSPYEHDCFYAACESLGIRTLILSANPEGTVNPDEVELLFRKHRLDPNDISFIECIYASNETGVLQPITELGKIAKQYQIPLLSDTIQVAGKFPYDFSVLDGFAVNGHKIGAGLGCSLFVSKDSKRIQTLFRGGLQENEFRAGTENLFAIKNLKDAFEWQMDQNENYKKIQRFQNQIEEFLEKECEAIVVAKKSKRIANTTYAIFPNLKDFDFVLISLDQNQIVCSTGSSCKSRTRQPSALLLNMGFSKELSLQALRFSTGIFTDSKEVDDFCKIFKNIYKSLI